MYRIKLLLISFIIISNNKTIAQELEDPRYRLGIAKLYDEKEMWASTSFVSIEPSSSHTVASLTISKCGKTNDDNSALTGRKGSQYFYCVSEKDFNCIEKILHHSFIKAGAEKPIDRTRTFAYLIYFHHAPVYSESLVEEYSWLKTFFLSTIEEVECADNCLSAETKQNILPLLKWQLEYTLKFPKKKFNTQKLIIVPEH